MEAHSHPLTARQGVDGTAGYVPPRGQAALVAALLCSLLALPAVQAADSATATAADTEKAVTLDKTVVEAESEDPAIAAALKQLSAIPGNTSLIRTDDTLQANPVLSQKAIFDFQPGVYAQGSGTSESVKISIRGSGLGNAVTYNRGINILFDGLTFAGFAMSGHAVAFSESLGLDHTEVFVGSNGFDYQSLGLGGAINYVSKTGYTADRFLFRLDTGSFGYVSAQLASGGVSGKNDYYASLVTSHSDGFQPQSRKDAIRLLANFGHKFNDNVDTRFYLRFADVKQESPGSLSLLQIDDNPKQAVVNNILGNSFQRSVGAYWIGTKTTVKIDDESRLVFGGSFDDVPFQIATRDLAVKTSLESYYNQSNLSYVAQYENDGDLGGSKNSVHLALRGLSVQRGDNFARNYTTLVPSTYGQIVRQRDTSGTGNTVLSLSDDYSVSKDLTFRLGASAIHTVTRNFITVANSNYSTGAIDNTNSSSKAQDYNWVTGLTYKLTPDIDLFGNVSRSVEQPTAVSKSNTITNSSSLDLKNQHAITYEVGVRGKKGIFEGSLSVYHTDLRNEFLDVQISAGPPPVTLAQNASPTVHQGIEAALDTTLWQNGKGGSSIVLRQSFTLNDFYFTGDPIYGKNAIPTIPPEIYQSAIQFNHSSGLFFNVHARAASAYYFDYYNTTKVPGYAVWGSTIGYEPAKGSWSAYVSVENAFDRNYIVGSRAVALGTTSTATHAVGDPFGVYVGFSFHL